MAWPRTSDESMMHLSLFQLVKLQTISKKTIKRAPKLPSIVDTKLDNRPKTLYVTGLPPSDTLDTVRQVFKLYQLEKIELSDYDVPFFAVKLKTRKEADKVRFAFIDCYTLTHAGALQVYKEMNKALKEKNVSLSFDKPKPVCDPLDFPTRVISLCGVDSDIDWFSLVGV